MKALNPFLKVFIFLFSFVMIPSCDLFDNDDPPVDESEIGDVLWEHKAFDQDKYFILNSMAYDNNTIYYAQGGGTVIWTPTRINAVNAETGELKWSSAELDHMDLSSDIVIGDGGVIYAIGFYTLYAIDPNNGEFLWTWKVPETIANSDGGELYTFGQIGSLAIAKDGSLVLGSIGSGVYHRGIYGIDKSGTKRWHNLTANEWGATSLVINKDNIAYYYSSLNGKDVIYALDIANGSVLWTKEIDLITSSANNILITDKNSLICAVGLNGEARRLHEIDCSSGDVLWSSIDEVGYLNKIMNHNGVVFFDAPYGIYTLTIGGNGIKNKLIDPHFMDGVKIDSKNRFAMVHNIGFETNLVSYEMDGSQAQNIPYPGIDHRLFLLIPGNKLIVRANNTIAALQADATLSQSGGWPSYAHDMRNSRNVSR